MISSAPSLNYLPLDTTGSPTHKDEVFGFNQSMFLQMENRDKMHPEIAYHINRGTLIFKGNVLVLQTLHGDRQRGSLLGR